MITLTVKFLDENINECPFMLWVIHNKVKFNHPLMSVINKIQMHFVPITIPLLKVPKGGDQKGYFGEIEFVQTIKKAY